MAEELPGTHGPENALVDFQKRCARKRLPIEDLARHPDFDHRLKRSEADVAKYAEIMKDNPAAFPAAKVAALRENGVETSYLIDGQTQVAARKLNGELEIDADVVDYGDDREGAVATSIASNLCHGRALTSAEKRAAVQKVAAQPRFSGASDRAIAKYLGVSPTFVGKVRRPAPQKTALPVEAPSNSETDTSCTEPPRTSSSLQVSIATGDEVASDTDASRPAGVRERLTEVHRQLRDVQTAAFESGELGKTEWQYLTEAVSALDRLVQASNRPMQPEAAQATRPALDPTFLTNCPGLRTAGCPPWTPAADQAPDQEQA